MKNWVSLLNLLRFMPSTTMSSIDLMCGDIAWVLDGTVIETYFLELLNLRSIVLILPHSVFPAGCLLVSSPLFSFSFVCWAKSYIHDPRSCRSAPDTQSNSSGMVSSWTSAPKYWHLYWNFPQSIWNGDGNKLISSAYLRHQHPKTCPYKKLCIENAVLLTRTSLARCDPSGGVTEEGWHCDTPGRSSWMFAISLPLQALRMDSNHHLRKLILKKKKRIWSNVLVVQEKKKIKHRIKISFQR